MKIPAFALGLDLALSVASPAFAKVLIHADSLIDGRADAVRKNVTMVVAGERIETIADGFTAPAEGDTVIDLKTSTLMPGLMDMHVLADISLMTKVSFVMKAGAVYKQ